MKRFKVAFTGFVYVEAETEAEAFEKAQNGDTVYEETEFQIPEKVKNFKVEV